MSGRKRGGVGRGATVLVMEVDRPVTALVEAAAALVDASAEVEAIEDENELWPRRVYLGT